MINEALGQTVINLNLLNYVSVVVEPKYSPEEMAAVPEARQGVSKAVFDNKRFQSDVMQWVGRIGQHLAAPGHGENWRDFTRAYQNLGVLQLVVGTTVHCAFGFDQEEASTSRRSAFLALKVDKVFGEFYREELADQPEVVRQFSEHMLLTAVHTFADVVLRMIRWQAWIRCDQSMNMSCTETSAGYSVTTVDPFKVGSVAYLEDVLFNLLGREKDNMDLTTAPKDEVIDFINRTAGRPLWA